MRFIVKFCKIKCTLYMHIFLSHCVKLTKVDWFSRVLYDLRLARILGGESYRARTAGCSPWTGVASPVGAPGGDRTLDSEDWSDGSPAY